MFEPSVEPQVSYPEAPTRLLAQQWTVSGALRAAYKSLGAGDGRRGEGEATAHQRGPYYVFSGSPKTRPGSFRAWPTSMPSVISQDIYLRVHRPSELSRELSVSVLQSVLTGVLRMRCATPTVSPRWRAELQPSTMRSSSSTSTASCRSVRLHETAAGSLLYDTTPVRVSACLCMCASACLCVHVCGCVCVWLCV